MPKTSATKTRFDINQAITDKLIAAIDAGTAPWQSPYLTGGLAMSMSTGRTYRGINPLLLAMEAADKGYTSRWWGTYEKVTERGGQIRKGEKSTMVTFWSRTEKDVTDATTGKTEKKTFFFLRFYKVFNAEQADWENGIPEKFATADRDDDFDPIAEADAIVLGYTGQGGPRVEHKDQGCAWYMPSRDTVNVPNPQNIRGTDAYYSTMFHELTHSTGHSSRLNRDGVANLGAHRRGSVYAFEELIAEFGAAMLSAHAGITETIDNSAAYLQGWLRFLRDDPAAAVKAASQAQKAVDHILGTVWDES